MALTVTDPADSREITALPPVVVSVVLVMLALVEPLVMDQVTWRSSAEDGEVVAVRVIEEPTSPDVLPEIEIEVTGVEESIAIKVNDQ